MKTENRACGPMLVRFEIDLWNRDRAVDDLNFRYP